jgi:hypothetical protein
MPTVKATIQTLANVPRIAPTIDEFFGTAPIVVVTRTSTSVLFVVVKVVVWDVEDTVVTGEKVDLVVVPVVVLEEVKGSVVVFTVRLVEPLVRDVIIVV